MGGDIKGGGLMFYQIPEKMNPGLAYGEGLTVPYTQGYLHLDYLMHTATHGKKKYFERVYILDKI